MLDYELLVVDNNGNDVGDPFLITDEMKQNPQLILDKINSVIKDETSNEDDED